MRRAVHGHYVAVRGGMRVGTTRIGRMALREARSSSSLLWMWNTSRTTTTTTTTTWTTNSLRASLRLHPHSSCTTHHLGSLSYFSSSRRPPSNKNNRLVQGVSVLGTSAIVLLGKGKYLLGALKLTKLASLGSMLVTVGTYSIFFGWPYAVGMVGLVLVHETGHALVMVHRNIPFSPMVFMPFMGATILMKRRPGDAWEDALVAFGGPILGTMGAMACTVGGHATDSQLLYALADFGYMINLFNMLPLGMMDGGRIAGALSPYAGVMGLGAGGLLAYNLPIVNPLFYLIYLAGAYETFQRFTNPHVVPPHYYQIGTGQRAILTGGYFGLVGLMVAAMAYNSEFRKPPQQLEQEKHWDMR